MRALRSVMGWRSRSAWSMKKDPASVTGWNHKVGFHNRGVQWDTPMSRWAGQADRNKAADVWAKESREEECVDTANVAWSEVACLCGFYDGSCERGPCGAGVLI